MTVVEGSLAATWKWPAYALPALVLQVVVRYVADFLRMLSVHGELIIL